ncbi:accessory gene regulator B family protein [Paenibacillus sp. GD4]|uniref:accessory gene regulator B family protein n=1 Tax=Paenibacillus sp. GD4 TaxID=3068890 RepID=UPI002796D3AF|nr:accessory gene regulator B family protein [Paenibacillus sp. GD4]MDQ1909864.1 accessory gene regulator B family protein [Paenibacillus sp. GD4]
MNFIDRSANSLAKVIYSHYPEGASETVLRYSLTLLINTVTSVSFVIIFSFFTNHLLEAICVIAFYTILRFFSGGMHMPTSLACSIASILTFIIVTHIDYNFQPFGLLLTIVSALILLKTAPNNMENSSSVNPKYYPHLKVISVLIVLSNLYFHSSFLASAALAQALLTTKIAYKFSDYIEGRTNA